MLTVRNKHYIEVDIAFDEKTFRITYRDSRNMNYNGQTIHWNYNNWCRNPAQPDRQRRTSRGNP
jgi:hypothetical protein